MIKAEKNDENTGQNLLADRIRDARITAVAFLNQLPAVRPLQESLGPYKFYVAGVGPGEAHARYLVHLLHGHTEHTARFVPLSETAQLKQKAKAPNAFYIVFSQDLNPHSQGLLKAWPETERLILFTAATSTGFFTANKDVQGLLLQSLESADAMIVRHPKERETTLFLQVVGPMCGYIAAVHWMNKALGTKIKMIESEELEKGLMKVIDLRKSSDWDKCLEETARTDDIWTTGALAVYAQNLGLKLSKGLFRRMPSIRDVHQFADGPFQSAFRSPSCQWLLATPDRMGAELTTRFRSMCSSAGIPTRLWRSPLPEPWAVLYFEQLFNFLILALVNRRKLDLEYWPGKGMDGSIYELTELTAPAESSMSL